MSSLRGGVLGLFPGFGEIGGVERSGRDAWQAVSRASAGPNDLICFDGAGGAVPKTRAKMGVLARAVSRGWPVNVVLCWHAGMLKLLPFLRTGGARTVLFLHGIEAWKQTSPAGARLLRRVDLFLSNSDYTWERFLAYHPDLRSAAHRTVALGLGSPLPDGPGEAPSSPPCAVMIGRIARTEAYKGHGAVIAAWSEVAERIPGARLRMIGPSEMTAELMSAAAARGVADHVEIAGPVSETAKERSLREARCMALPSRGEGFGLAYVESMRMGRPCLVSTLDAGREVVCPEDAEDSAGLAVDPSDTRAVSAALIRLMTPGPEWERRSAAARRRYAAHYTEAAFGERLVAALGSLP